MGNPNRSKAEKDMLREVEADLEDIALANELTGQILGKSLDELSAPARELLILLDELVEQQFRELQEIDKESVPSHVLNRLVPSLNSPDSFPVALPVAN